MVDLTVKALPERHWGRQLVQLNIAHRDNANRYDILQISQGGKSELCLCLGHNNTEEIYLDFDVRKALNVGVDNKANFKIRKVGWFGKIRWYFSTRDPAVYIPAWIALFSIILGITGIVLAIISLCHK